MLLDSFIHHSIQLLHHISSDYDGKYSIHSNITVLGKINRQKVSECNGICRVKDLSNIVKKTITKEHVTQWAPGCAARVNGPNLPNGEAM